MNECVDLLYARYGRGELQQQLQLMFGSTDDWQNQAHEITFREYLKIVAVGQQQKVENARKIKAVRRNSALNCETDSFPDALLKAVCSMACQMLKSRGLRSGE